MPENKPALNPHALLNVTWQPEFTAVLKRLQEQEGDMSMRRRLALKLLDLLSAGWTNICTRDVVRRIYTDDKPSGGWTNFNFNTWYSHMPAVLDALQSSDPMKKVSKL